jgi:UDP-N-acetylmuramoyl-tripeptide--D-alanyl-D-alanine ligase
MISFELLVLIASISVAVVVAALMNLKWVRVAQRVHYLPGEVSRIERLWFDRRPQGLIWMLGAIALGIISVWGSSVDDLWWVGGLVACGPLLLLPTPWGMPFRGTTSPLAWTSRAQRFYAGVLILQAVLGAVAVWVLGPVGILVPLLLAATLSDAVLQILWLVEKRLNSKFVVDARRKLKRVNPTVVAITGSYGKTSTKGYVAHLVGNTHSTVASPASFNNLMGLSRTINEHLTVGTGVFVAEMGMNEEGRIRELSRLFKPDIAAITVIGEAHMERLGSKEAIFRAKAEITENTQTVVLPVDQPELVSLIEKCRRENKTVITVSGMGKPADITVDPDLGLVRYGPDATPQPMDVPPFGHGVNMAVALGIAWALEVPEASALEALRSVPVAAHRAEVARRDEGVWIVDDTYNSNPVGAAHAVDQAAALASERGGPLVVVTPGMVELGPVQFQRNTELAQRVAEKSGHLMVVGLTNRKALLAGADGRVQTFHSRSDAVEAALRAAGDKGVILYENDLPDHYP